MEEKVINSKKEWQKPQLERILVSLDTNNSNSSGGDGGAFPVNAS